MKIPDPILALLIRHNLLREKYDPGTHECVGAKFHSPRPLRVFEIKYGARGQSLWLCGTCRSNMGMFLEVWDATDGEVEWEVQRSFGNMLRSAAMLVIEGRREMQLNG